ncbi:ATP-binding cassette domain-containing protein [Mycolicibacillus trivialis]
MNQPGAPALTVRHEGTQRTFSPGHDVVVGRDLRADVRIAHPLVSRTHLLLRFDGGRWLAVDNDSLNGIFVNGHRVPVATLGDGQSINLGNPDGPRLSFEVGRHQGAAGRPPATAMMRAAAQPGPPAAPPQLWPPHQGAAYPGPPYPGPPPSAPRPQIYPGPQHGAPHPPPPPVAPPRPAAPAPDLGPQTHRAPVAATPPEESNVATRMVDILGLRHTPETPSNALTIGRATDNDVVIPDVLASRHHAMLVPTPIGTEIRDNRSINGTFVNRVRIGSAVLTEGDVVTIGNVDLVFTNGTLVRSSEAATKTGGLEVNSVNFTVEGGKQLISNVSMTCRPGTLTAIIGGSGAGKTTLSRLIAGYTTPSSGSVTFEGHNIHTDYAVLRSRIGMVPQDDVVHRQLTVNQALGYAAELRLPPDSTKADRDQAVAQVLEELELTKHADTRVDKLSGGQRKRASVALELLTGPSLLILDEPTSGLDPALDRQVMLMLRQLADAGRVVLVVTHSVSFLDVCDQIMLLAPGGKTAYCGPPSQIGAAMGSTNYADIFAKVGADPDAANQRFMESSHRPNPTPDAQSPADLGDPPRTDVLRQLSTIARRQIRLVISDRGYTVFLALLPFLIGALSLTVKGKGGLGMPGMDAPTEPQYVMVLLNIGAVFMGTALTIRDLIGERPIFKREQAVGLSTTAYLMAKVAVFCVFATVQAAIATTIVILGKGGPTQGALLFGHSNAAANVELFLAVAGTCVASAILGLALSSFAQSSEQIMPMLVVAIMGQLVLSGGMIPVTGRLGLDQVSWLTPARWGYAASASTIDFNHLLHHDASPPNCMPLPTAEVPEPAVPEGCTPALDVKQIPQDSLWKHSTGTWLFDMAMLVALSVLYSGVVRWKIRLHR